MKLLEKLTQLGQEARQKFIKASHGSAVVYFKLPTQVVKIENTAGKVSARLNRLLVEALNGAYGKVVGEMASLAKKKAGKEEVLKVHEQQFMHVAEGDVVVVMNGSQKVVQIGTKIKAEDQKALKEYLNSIQKAFNTGSVKANQKTLELLAKHLK